jgi:GT2 family glycosyltransferase
MPPRVHVLILNWNGWRDTLECLETVFRLDHPSFQVIVCDNASSDGSVERIVDWATGQLAAELPAGQLRHLTPGAVPKPIRYAVLDRAEAERGGDGEDRRRALRSAELLIVRTGANLGFAGGNNVGLAYLLASGAAGFVWMLNNDMVVDRYAMRHMVDVIEADATIGCVGATLLEYSDPEVVQAAGGGRLVRWQGMPRETTAAGQRRGTPGAVPRRLDFISCGCMLVRLSVVAEVGLIDERYFMYCEDIDYSLRIRATGRRIGYAPAAEVWHKGGSSTIYGSPRHDYYLVRSALLLVHKFDPALLPLAVGFSLYRCALPKMVRLQGARLGAVARGYRDFLSCAWFGAPPMTWEPPSRAGTI